MSNPEADVVIKQFNAYRQDIAATITQINDLEQEKIEHSLVVKTLSELDPSRRCMRLVGGVLCERTIKEVLPSVQENEVRIAQVIDRLSEDLKKKEAALAEFKKEHSIVVRGEESKA